MGAWNIQHVAQFVAVQQREVVGSQNAFAFAGEPVHFRWIARSGRKCGAIHQSPDVRRHKDHRRAVDLYARVANALHFTDAWNGPKLVRHRSWKTEAARGEALGRRNEQIGIERHSEPFENRVVTGAREPTERNHQCER